MTRWQGSGFSHLWCTAHILHLPGTRSADCWQLIGGCLSRKCPLVEGAAYPSFAPPLGCLHLVTDSCWGYKDLARLPHYGTSLKDQLWSSLWDWLKSLAAASDFLLLLLSLGSLTPL